MALSYRATPATVQSAGDTTTLAVTKQAGTAAGDWILIYVMCPFLGALACTGFTATLDPFPMGGLLRRLADGTESATFTVTGLSSSQSTTAVIVTVAGATTTLDPATPNTPDNPGSSVTSFPLTSTTLANSGDWVILFAANQSNANAPSYAITLPSGFTSRATNGAQTANPCIVAADNVSFAPGATGTQTCTSASTAYWSGVLVGLSSSQSTSQLTITQQAVKRASLW